MVEEGWVKITINGLVSLARSEIDDDNSDDDGLQQDGADDYGSDYSFDGKYLHESDTHIENSLVSDGEEETPAEGESVDVCVKDHNKRLVWIPAVVSKNKEGRLVASPFIVYARSESYIIEKLAKAPLLKEGCVTRSGKGYTKELRDRNRDLAEHFTSSTESIVYSSDGKVMKVMKIGTVRSYKDGMLLPITKKKGEIPNTYFVNLKAVSRSSRKEGLWLPREYQRSVEYMASLKPTVIGFKYNHNHSLTKKWPVHVHALNYLLDSDGHTRLYDKKAYVPVNYFVKNGVPHLEYNKRQHPYYSGVYRDSEGNSTGKNLREISRVLWDLDVSEPYIEHKPNTSLRPIRSRFNNMKMRAAQPNFFGLLVLTPKEKDTVTTREDEDYTYEVLCRTTNIRTGQHVGLPGDYVRIKATGTELIFSCVSIDEYLDALMEEITGMAKRDIDNSILKGLGFGEAPVVKKIYTVAYKHAAGSGDEHRLGKRLGKGGCCPPTAIERIAACPMDKPANTIEDFVEKFHIVRADSAALKMPKQPLLGHGGRVMKNLCWLPVVSAASEMSSSEVMQILYGCDVNDEQCPDNREDPVHMLSEYLGVNCSGYREADIYGTQECKELMTTNIWSSILQAVESSRSIILLARSQSYKTYVHCLMVAGICKEGNSMLVTDPCEQGVFRADMKCATGSYMSDKDARGSLELQVHVDKNVERYRILGIAIASQNK